MNKITKTILLSLITSIIFTFSGCTPIELNIEKILTPPKLSDLQISITTALESAIDEEFSIKYPKNGQYSSGFNFIDLNDDGIDEALCFFKTKSKNTIKMAVLYCEDENWYVGEILSDLAYSGDINFVDYREIGGKNKLLIGLQPDETSQSLLALYDCEQNIYGSFELNLNKMFDYSELLITDFDGDGMTDILFFELSDKFSGSSPNMYCFGIDEYDVLFSKGYQILPNDILSFQNVQIGNIDSDTKCIIIDAKLYDNNYTTYVYRIVDNEFLPLEMQEANYRKIPVISSDIDNDGIIEIPYQNIAYGYDKQAGNAEYFIDYIQFKITSENNNIIAPESIDQKTYIDYNNSIYFKIPKQWQNPKLSIFTYQDKSEIVFFINENDDVFDHKITLLKIKVYSSQEVIDKLDVQRYFDIANRNGKIYMGYLPMSDEENITDENKEIIKKYKDLIVTEQEIKDLFTIL